MKLNNDMRDYDSWLTSFLDYEDDDGLTEEERQELKDLYDEWVIDQYETNKQTNKLRWKKRTNTRRYWNI